MAAMKPPSWALRSVPYGLDDLGGQVGGGDHPGVDGVLEVVADVGDAIGPGHDLALRRRRGRAVPGVVADGVQRLGAQVQGLEHDVGAVDGVVVAALQVRRQGVLGRVAGRTVAAVVTQGGGQGQGLVQAGGPGDGRGHLAHLDGVGQAGPQVIVVGRQVDLALAGQAPEGPAVLDAVEVPLEAGPVGIGVLGPRPGSGARRRGSPRGRARACSRSSRSRRASGRDLADGERGMGPGHIGPVARTGAHVVHPTEGVGR